MANGLVDGILALADPAFKADTVRNYWRVAARNINAYIKKYGVNSQAHNVIYSQFANAANKTKILLLDYARSVFENPVESAYLDALVSDLNRNARKAAEESLFAGLIAQANSVPLEDFLNTVANRYGYRAALGYRVGRIRVDNESVLADIYRTGKKKKWIARVEDSSNRPCKRCLDLHGTVMLASEMFQSEGPIYVNLLVSPLHPNCRCKIIPV